MMKNSLKTRLKGSRGITLIALVISVIVLLILAGVSISAITGNDSAMKKAQQARTESQNADELDTIKLAIVEAVAAGYTGEIDGDVLEEKLEGIATVEPQTTGDVVTSYKVTGNKSHIPYEVQLNGSIESKSGITLTPASITLTDTTTYADLEATISPDLSGTINWSIADETVATISDTTGSSIRVTKVAESGSTTITATLPGTSYSKTCTVTVKKPLAVGNTVNYSTTLNNQTLSNWKVFYIDSTNNKVWIILDDYLPRAAISSDLKTNYNLADGNGTTYTIKSTTNRTDLINAMATTNWTDLINNGSMNGTALTSAVKSDPNVKAMGAPDIELWCNSWNSASNGFSTTITPSQNATGYQVNNENVLTIPSGDKNKANYPLYLPHKSDVDSCNGYWLASLSARDTNCVFYVSFNGYVDFYRYSGANSAFRPVVCLPSSIF